jgi:N-acetylglucosamine-6-phosphate deacetylase
LGQGRVRLLTLAAEVSGAEALTRMAVDRGVAVSLGHSLFTMADLDRLHVAGARSLTHLGNGLPNLLPRHPNPLWDGLAHDGYTAMLIADGHHLPLSVLRVAARAKGHKRIVVVSDASPVAGLSPGEYDVLGIRAILEASGRLYNPERQCLVGSSAMMADCVAFLEEHGIFEDDAITQVAVTNPLRLIGMDLADVQWSSTVVPM